jgi:hypothetical protein
MILKLTGMILTREQVEKIAANNPDTTEIDFSEADVYSASAMHQIVCSFPQATMSGLEGGNKEQYEWVLTAMNSEGFKRNQKGHTETES